jgi:hypothetical protein
MLGPLRCANYLTLQVLSGLRGLFRALAVEGGGGLSVYVYTTIMAADLSLVEAREEFLARWAARAFSSKGFNRSWMQGRSWGMARQPPDS